MAGELALVREAGLCGDLRQGQVCPCLQEVLGPLDAAQDDVLVRRQPRGPLELSREAVGTGLACGYVREVSASEPAA